MAHIIVVKTCDGDVYFRGNRNHDKVRAVDMATDQVLVHNLERYDDEDRAKVREAHANRDWNALWDILVECRAITTRNFQ